MTEHGELTRAEATRIQALYREVNERVRDVAAAGSYVEYLCECGDTLCSQGIVLPTDEYDTVRRFPTRFLVRPWHHSLEDERVTA